MIRQEARSQWRYEPARAAYLWRLIQMAMQPLFSLDASVALLTIEGETLFAKRRNPVDLTTLTAGAMSSVQYLKLGDGDVMMFNEPSIAGSSLDDLSFVIAIGRDSFTRWLIAVRTPAGFTAPSLPPLPVASLVKASLAAGHRPTIDIQTSLLQAIAGQNSLPEQVIQLIETMAEVRNRFKAIESLNEDVFSESSLASYQAAAARAFASAMARVPLGGATNSQRLPTGELIKLQVELNEKSLIFDFKNTDESRCLGLSEHGTFSVAASAALDQMGFDLPPTASVLSHFQITAPTKSLLSSRKANEIARGVKEAAPFIYDFVSRTIAELAHKQIERSPTKRG